MCKIIKKLQKSVYVFFLFTFSSAVGIHVAVFLPCFPSHITPHIGIIKELLLQGHSVTCIVNRGCHDGLKQLNVNLVHNYGDTHDTVLENLQGNANIFNSLNVLFGSHLSAHQDVIDYFQENKIDVILSSMVVLSSTLIADKFNIPLIFNSYQLGFIISETCTDCNYKGTISIGSPFATLSPSLPVVVIDKLLTCLFTIATYSLLKTYNSQRSLLELEEILPYNVVLYNFARFPIVYQTYFPLIPPSVHLPDGRWLVGYISPGNKINDLSDEYVHFLKEFPSQPVVYICFGTIVRISIKQLHTLYQQLITQNNYKVIWSLPKYQQDKITDYIGLNDLPKHVKLVDYAPQKALLLTKEVEIFVNHGGYSSIVESINSQTPLLLFPLMGDQFYNSNIMVEIGCALQYRDIDTTHFNILSLFQNIKDYKNCMENAKQLMSRARGAPQVVEILERLSSQGYEGMSFDQYTENVIGFYSASLTLLSIPIFILAVSIGICYFCCLIGKNKATSKMKDE